MKKKLLLILASCLAVLAVNPVTANEDIPELIKEYYFPEFDFKNVQFLTDGHLGKNKPRLGKFKWRMAESLRFRVYTYEASEELVDAYLSVAESTFKEYNEKFQFGSFSDKITIIIYNTVQDFEETNLVPGLVPKGLGGLTEVEQMQRVLVAFRGSMIGFRRLVRHELTHRYHISMLQSGAVGPVNWPPLWFIEGAAEHFAHEWDAYGELVMRSAYLDNGLAQVTDPYWYSSALIYKQGKFVVDFLAERHKDKGEIVSMILRLCGGDEFKIAFQKATGESLEEFQRALNDHIERRYHHLRIKKDLTEKAKVVDTGVVLASKDQFFVTKKMILGRSVLMLNWTDGAKVVSKKLVEDGRLRSVALRGFPLETSPEFGFSEHGVSFGPDNTVVYAVDVGGRDEARIQSFSFDMKKKKIRLGKKIKLSPKDIRYIQHPLLVDSDTVAFIGRVEVFSEIYLYNIKTQKLRKLTEAKRNYRGLTYSKQLNALVTSAENEGTGSYDLVYGDLSAATWQFLTFTLENEFGPEFGPDGRKLIYVSDKDLVFNLSLHDLSAKTHVTLSDAQLGVFNPKWLSGNSLVFNGVAQGEFKALANYLPGVSSAVSATSLENKTEAADSSDAKFRALLPNLGQLTVVKKVISPDRKKALFAVNRHMSFDKLNKKDDVINFYLVGLSDNSVTWFALGFFKSIDSFIDAEFLAGDNLLIQGRFASLGGGSILNEYTQYYLYNYRTNKLIFIGSWDLRAWGLRSMPLIFRISDDRRYLAFYDQRKSKIKVYDVLEQKFVYDQKSGKVLDLKPLPNNRLLVVEKPGWLKRGHSQIRSIDWSRSVGPSFTSDDVFVSWHFLPDNKKFFLIGKTDQRIANYNIYLVDVESLGIGLVQADLPGLGSVKIKDNALVADIGNPLPMTLNIDSKGKTTVEVKDAPRAVADPEPIKEPRVTMKPYVFPIHASVRRQWHRPKKLPTMRKGYIGMDSNLHSEASLVARVVAYDVLSDRVFYTDTMVRHYWGDDVLRKGLFGFADVNYFNLAAGHSLGLDYWHRSDNFEKREVRASQNIFLHEFLNWDVTLRRQYVHATRSRGLWPHETVLTREWRRNYLGTTFSLDTTIDDWHGPISGNAAFTSIEVGIDDDFGYQSLDLNWDARHYLPFTERSGLAFRFAGGTSFGPNPTSFVWGGNKTFRGIPLFSQSGNSYVLQSTELRVPLFDFVRAKASNFIIDAILFPFTTTVDMRGGIYNDLGDMWNRRGLDGVFEQDHSGFNLQSSTGVFLNVPSLMGFTLRFNWAMAGKKVSGFWMGRNF